MKKMLWSLTAIALIAGHAAVAQPPSGQWFILHQEQAKPSQLAAYEAGAKEFKQLVEANRAAMPDFYFTVLQGDDFTYTYAVRIKNFAGLDGIMAQFGAMAQAAGPKFGELMQRSSAYTESWSEFVVGEEPGMGYHPANPKLKADDAKYFHYALYYVMPGKEEAATALSKDYVALFTSKNIGNGYNIYWALTGEELPLLVVEQWANDEAEFHANEATTRAALGDALKALDQRALAITRRIENKSAWLRPDLSSWPAAPAKK